MIPTHRPSWHTSKLDLQWQSTGPDSAAVLGVVSKSRTCPSMEWHSGCVAGSFPEVSQ